MRFKIAEMRTPGVPITFDSNVTRHERIDALCVDRTFTAKVPLRPFCSDAEAAEGRLSAIRAATLLSERVSIWRHFYAQKNPKK